MVKSVIFFIFGGHFEKTAIKKIAAIFGRVTPAHIFLNVIKM